MQTTAGLTTYLNTLIPVLFLLFLTTCGDVSGPTNLEPEIRNLEVTDISRNSAILSAYIENRSTEYLDKFHFKYQAGDGDWVQSADIENPSGRVETVITGLSAGMTYTVCAEGTRKNAFLKTATIRFTTKPNDVPSISDLRILSSGPTSVIVSFRMLSDGGTPLTEAGCQVKKSSGNTSVNVKAEGLSSSDNEFTILLNSLSALTDYEIRPYAINMVGEKIGNPLRYTTANSICLIEAGSLRHLLSGTALPEGPLTISGSMNGDDFRYLRSLPVAAVDLSGVYIAEGGLSYDGSRYTESDAVTTGLFADLPYLESVVLPFSVRKIGRDAFSGSSKLKSLEIPANVELLQPSADCESLEHISVSAANANFRDQDDAVFNSVLSEIIWYPQAKCGEYAVPSSVTVIKEYAFRNSSLDRLNLPAGLIDIERGAFTGSYISELDVPDKVTHIRDALFQNCRNLKTIRLGANIMYLGNNILDNTAAEHIHIKATVPPFVEKNAFSSNMGLFEECTLHVAPGTKTLYRNHPILGQFKNITESE